MEILSDKLQALCSDFRCNDDRYIVYHSHSDTKLFFEFETKTLFGKKDYPYLPFYAALWEQYLEGDNYCFSERQFTKSITTSGINLDFDLYQKDTVRHIDSSKLSWFITKFLKVLTSHIEFLQGYTTYAAVIMNSAPYIVEIIDTESTVAKIKEGFHILFPGIKLEKHFKQTLISIYNEKIRGKFAKYWPDQENYVDIMSSQVPQQIYGTIREKKKESHKLEYLYKLTYVGTEFDIADYPADLWKYVRRGAKTPSEYKINVPLELSLHFDGDLIKKTEFKQKSGVNMSTKYVNYIKSMENETEYIRREVEAMCESSFRAREVFSYIEILDPARGRSGNYAGWRNVLIVIFNINLKFKNIGKLFSIYCDKSCWERGGEAELNKIWEFVEESLKTVLDIDAHQSKYFNILRKMALQDSPEKYKEANTKTLHFKVSNIVTTGVPVTHNMIAELIHNLVGTKYVYTTTSRSGVGSVGFWYEYITPDRGELPTTIKPFVYKWYKHIDTPKEIDYIISRQLPNVLIGIKTYYSDLGKSTEDKERKKMFKEFQKKINRIIEMCGTSSHISSIESRCAKGYFRSEDFLSELDKIPNMLGVGNGILFLPKSKPAVLIESATFEKLTRTTDTPYIVYDANNTYVKEVEEFLQQIEPNPKRLEAILMHHSMSMVKCGVPRYFTIYFSGGSSGKSSIMNLLSNAFGHIGRTGYGPGFGFYSVVTAAAFVQEKKDLNGVDHHMKEIRNALFVHATEGDSRILQMNVIKSLRDGIALRGMYQDTETVIFPGMIGYVSNHKPKLLNHNLANARRLLFLYFSQKFVFHEPREPNERRRNSEYEDKTLHDKNWGAAFLSILVHHWNRLQTEYGGNIETVLESSGLLADTNEFLSEQNHLVQFVNLHCQPNPDAKIELLKFAQAYTSWFNKHNALKIPVSPDTFKGDIYDYFGDKIEKISGIEYILKHELTL